MPYHMDIEVPFHLSRLGKEGDKHITITLIPLFDDSDLKILSLLLSNRLIARVPTSTNIVTMAVVDAENIISSPTAYAALQLLSQQELLTPEVNESLSKNHILRRPVDPKYPKK